MRSDGAVHAADSSMHQGLAERLVRLHREVKGTGELTAVTRIAVALYDERTDILKTFIHSSDGGSPLDHSSARLDRIPGLHQLALNGMPRVINDLDAVALSGQEHATRLAAVGYRSSYTVPIRTKGQFYGFLFINASEKDFFTPQVTQRLHPYAELIGQMVMRELDAVHMMRAAVRVIRRVSTVRDEETGAHLARMARYARLVAQKLAGKFDLSDEFVEYLFQFAPLHDVGKISVPDHILFKPGKLTFEEFNVMKTHVVHGIDITDMLIFDFGSQSLPHFDLLRNVVAYHHEALDGSGYPHGLAGDRIPLEARIATVADVFDALTSVRPYKQAWTNEAAFDLLRREAGIKFDPECVAALLDSTAEIEAIQVRFEETVLD